MGEPISPVAQGKTSSRATTSLVLGILGFVCCQICAPIAWYLGSQELQAIQAGQSSSAGQGVALAGKVLGIIGTILFVLAIAWVVFFGGMAVLSALAEGARH